MDRHDYRRIPAPCRRGLDNYVAHRQPGGGFLTAVLENDLEKAVSKADYTNINLLPVYVSYLLNQVTAECWGSPAKVRAWLGKGGLSYDERTAIIDFLERCRANAQMSGGVRLDVNMAVIAKLIDVVDIEFRDSR